MPSSLNVLAIGGPHHLAHFLPVACEIHRRCAAKVTIFAADAADVAAIRKLAGQLDLPVPEIVEMTLPPLLSRILPPKAHKMARLLFWARRLRSCDALLTAERTSTILKRIPGKCPPMIHIPHGAGDAVVGFERRFTLFDQVLVAGQKDKDRLVAMGRVSADSCYVTGSIKVSGMLRLAQDRAPLFDNDRPVVLYNPHFKSHRGSFHLLAKRLVAAIVKDGRYNLVVAPHIRLAQHWDEQQRARWEALAVPGRVMVDLGSDRSVDMTYTLGANLYLGDVSSQVYEFLVKPRPCLFVNTHAADYEADENYAMWQFGDVVTPDCDIIPAIDQAFADHRLYRARQEQRARYALGGIEWDKDGAVRFAGDDPIVRAASVIEAFLEARSARRRANSVLSPAQ
jgi:hypothetical protein